MAKIKYKGELLAEITDGQPITLHTTGHSLSGDITIEDLGGSGGVIEVDELPTENIDTNAFYYCDGKYYKFQPSDGKTWIFNDELNFDGLEIDKKYEVNYTYLNSEASYIGFTYGERAGGVYALNYVEYKYGGDFTTPMYHTDALWGMPKGWLNYSAKTITFTEMPTDETFLMWLKSNATEVAGEWRSCVFGSAIVECDSPDELPEDADDGSISLIDVDAIRYVLSDTVELGELLGLEAINSYEASALFESADGLWRGMILSERDGSAALEYVEALKYTSTYLTYTVTEVNECIGWHSNVFGTKYKTVDVYWASPKIKAFLDKHADWSADETGTSYASGTVMFLREKGHWVAKTIHFNNIE